MKKDDKELGEIYDRDVRPHENHPGITGGGFAAEQERDMIREEEKFMKDALDEKSPEEESGSVCKS